MKRVIEQKRDKLYTALTQRRKKDNALSRYQSVLSSLKTKFFVLIYSVDCTVFCFVSLRPADAPKFFLQKCEGSAEKGMKAEKPSLYSIFCSCFFL